MVVARHGQIEVEKHFRGPNTSTATNVKSASKTILSALVGIALEEGFLEDLDQPVAPYFSEFLDPEDDAAKYLITVRDLLTMQSGLESTSSGNYGRWVLSPHWVSHAITRPMVGEPGARMIYSTGNSHLLSSVLTQATGSSTHAFSQIHLASPLGIRIPPWLSDPQGVYFGGNEMHLSALDLLRFGELYRNGGTLEGHQIVSREWVEESWREQTRSPRNGDVYGLGWWGRESSGYTVRFAWGYGGQFLFVVPALELTVVFTSDPVSPREGPHNRALHELLDRFLVPAAIAGATSPRAGQATFQRTET
jgi:CubicO group peptidase (beta-lactamase class C family)